MITINGMQAADNSHPLAGGPSNSMPATPQLPQRPQRAAAPQAAASTAAQAVPASRPRPAAPKPGFGSSSVASTVGTTGERSTSCSFRNAATTTLTSEPIAPEEVRDEVSGATQPDVRRRRMDDVGRGATEEELQRYLSLYKSQSIERTHWIPASDIQVRGSCIPNRPLLCTHTALAAVSAANFGAMLMHTSKPHPEY